MRRRCIDIADGEYVETQRLRVPLRVTHQEMACRKDDFAPLFPVDAVYGGSETALLAGADFDDDVVAPSLQTRSSSPSLQR
jgi:hypothetical protein